MRNFTVVLFLLVCFLPFAHGQETGFGQELPKAKPGTDYPIKVHISGVHIRSDCDTVLRITSCGDSIYVDATMNGLKVELMGDTVSIPGFYQADLVPGDYSARSMKKTSQTMAASLRQEYEIVFPDKTVWRCTVTGISE